MRLGRELVSQILKNPVQEMRTPGTEGAGVTMGGSFGPVRKRRFPPLTRQAQREKLFFVLLPSFQGLLVFGAGLTVVLVVWVVTL